MPFTLNIVLSVRSCDNYCDHVRGHLNISRCMIISGNDRSERLARIACPLVQFASRRSINSATSIWLLDDYDMEALELSE